MLTDNKKLSSVDVDVLIKNINKIEVEGITEIQLNNVIKEIKKDMSVIYDAGEINKRIKQIKKSTNVVESLTATQKQCKVLLSNEIGILQRQLKNAKGLEATNINKSIKKLQVWADGIKNFPDEEAIALNKLLGSGTDVKHISRILLADNPITLITKLENATSVRKFHSELRIAGLTGYADELKDAKKLTAAFKEFNK